METSWDLSSKIKSHLEAVPFQNSIFAMKSPNRYLSPRLSSLFQKSSVVLAKIGTVPLWSKLSITSSSAKLPMPNILQMDSWMGGKSAMPTSFSSTLIFWARYCRVQSQPCHMVMMVLKDTMVQVSNWTGSQPWVNLMSFSAAVQRLLIIKANQFLSKYLLLMLAMYFWNTVWVTLKFTCYFALDRTYKFNF